MVGSISLGGVVATFSYITGVCLFLSLSLSIFRSLTLITSPCQHLQASLSLSVCVCVCVCVGECGGEIEREREREISERGREVETSTV